MPKAVEHILPDAVEHIKAGEISADSLREESIQLRLWYLLSRTRDAVYKVRQKDLSECGLTTEQNFVLSIIHALVNQGMKDKVTPAEIARQMFRQSQSVSGLLRRMGRAGLVTRVKDLERRNMVRIEVTKKGHDRFEAALSARSMGKLIGCLSLEEREQLIRCLAKIHEAALDELGLEEVPMSIDYEKHLRKRDPLSGNRSILSQNSPAT